MQDDITQYANYFERQIEDVKRLKLRGPASPEQCWELPLYRKILYVSMIDTLSKAAFPAMKTGHHKRVTHRKRVTQFIDELSGWQDKDRVSVPQLLLRLNKAGQTSGSLYRKMQSCLDSWVDGDIKRLSDDPLLQNVLALAHTEEEKTAVRAARCAGLFYTYRNALVHEFRKPGYGMDGLSDNETTPYYVSMSSGGQTSWDLVFPNPFLEDLCRKCLSGLVNKLKAEQRNPYESYEFGSLWS